MSRHLLKLQALFAKLEARYGADDPAVQEVGAQLRTLEALEAQGAALRSARAPELVRPATELL